MGRTFDQLDEGLIAWIGQQSMFFVATAPSDPEGHVNVSPKGGRDTFRVLNPTTFAYLDLIGSGVETIAHLKENARIVVMFCAFDGPPKIVRLHGRGRVVEPHHPAFSELLRSFSPSAETVEILRSIIVVETTRIGDSCGFVVPRMELVEERKQLFHWGEQKAKTYGDTWKAEYEQANNRRSLDDLPGLSIEDEIDTPHAAKLSSVGRAL